MPDSTKARSSKRERENVNLSEKYEVEYAGKRTTPSKNHPSLTPSSKTARTAKKR